MTSAARSSIAAARSVVVKIGTTALTTPTGVFDAGRLAALVEAIESRMRAGSDVVIVSSGAIAAGIEPLGLSRRPTDLATKQAAASVGQVALVNAWSTAFARFDRTVGQVLLTAHDIAMRVQHNNAQRTLDRLRALSGCRHVTGAALGAGGFRALPRQGDRARRLRSLLAWHRLADYEPARRDP